MRRLLDRGWPVTATGRGRDPPNLTGLGVAYEIGDADEPGRLEGWIDGHDLVVDAAAPYPVHLFRPGTDSEVDPFAHAERRTRRVLDAVTAAGARLAFVSSFTTLPRRRGAWEEMPSRAARRLHPYFAVKETMEARVLEAARGGLRAVVVNPTTCLGPWDLKTRDFCIVPQVLRGEVPVSVTHVLNVVDVREVAAGLVAALDAELYGEPIPICGHNISFDALVAWICEVGGAEPPRIRTPAGFGFLASYWAEAGLALSGRRSPCPSLAMLLVSECYAMTPGAAQQRLGVVPRPLSQTIRDTIDWYRRVGYC